MSTTRHLSTLRLHQLRYGELDGQALTEARAHLGACELCSGRLGVQERERNAFVVRPVPPVIQQLARPASRPWWRELSPLLGALMAATALFFATPTVRDSLEPVPAPPGILKKGGLPMLEAWVDVGKGPRPLHDGEALGAGARVQLHYDPKGGSSVALAGRDHTGTIEVYTTNAPTGIGLVQAPFALTLDDAPGTQELFVVSSPMPLDEMRVKAAITAGVPGAHVGRLVIQKEAHR
jgi:hypothetical protein